MPFFEKENVKIYYEDVGKKDGEPIITIHGLYEDGNYWSETGVTAKLAEKYRVISLDMRGHGRTIMKGEPYGYDASYVRVREVLLGYTWNLKTSVIQSIGLSLYGRNLGFLYNAAENNEERHLQFVRILFL